MGTENTAADRELDWNDRIEKGGGDFITLPAGDYDFTVESFERGRHAGSDKLPPCNKAVLKIRIEAPEGTTLINHNLFLHTKTEGMLSAFFESIGQKKKGEPLNMNWNEVPGSGGRCKLGIRHWENKEKGTEGDSNEIKRFYPKEVKGFKAGEF